MFKVSKKTKAGFLICLGLACLMLFFVFYIPHKLIIKSGPYSYAVYDQNSMLIGASVADDGQWRFSPGIVPEKFGKAIVAYEDKRFYQHLGVDLFSVVRAFVYNIKQGRIVSGGSTITMQTVRILEHNPNRTVLQKVHEAFCAIFLEARYSKKSILKLYAACAPFGGNVVGLEAASWRYFNRSPQDLTWAESATLAVLPNQPSLVHPGKNREILLQKRNMLLLKLLEKKIIDEQTYSLSLEEKLPAKPYSLPSYAPHYLEYLKKQSPYESKFYTGMNLDFQKNTRRILENWSERFAKQEINNAAALIIETQTGNVLAYCGNTGFIDGRIRNVANYSVDIIHSRRSSGSLLKPFLYCAMLDNGMLLPQQLVTDVPTRIGNYRPDNNIPIYRGVVPADEALTRSLNIPAVRELREYGISAFLAYLKSCGFSTFTRSSDDYGLPLILGGGEITLWEAVHVYASMMNKAGNLVSDFPSSCGSAYLTIDALQKGVRPEDEAMWQFYTNAKRIAWKTGTSSGNRDAWAIGTTPEYTIGVWFGNAEGKGTKDLTSVGTAAPVLFDLFSTLPQTTWPEMPYMELSSVKICKKSGFLAGIDCTDIAESYKPEKAAISKLCPYCRTVTFSPDEQFQATVDDMKNEYKGQMPVAKKWFVLPPALEYYYTKHSIGYKKLPDFVSWHYYGSEDNLEIIFPTPGANIIVPVEIDGNRGSIVLEAGIRDDSMEIFWDLDGEFIGTTDSIHKMMVSPKVGEHILTITDSIGTVKSRKFNVVDTE